ncbi:hypothetical protein BJV85_001334 [Clostridium acetobutylicum]|uniref:Uncharacterized protein n=1 Tax=Clostridium acetobutylicum (strain ATCC 824 / DSM 792 / JCM 1419 / IAM 19013 / LMG 5710 / NBRC 13948 / NRRL B-527 / VKM B-1787 / 2291 / W) TaxID=272562 RepID=Q97G17_CLOAB|nr:MULTISPECIES: hypothetical protein [Clostridium]AAK80506.1 Hypothetical protein CA_C2555 [Clostridium acetobutylicum ATCC 824]ADZ21605.1 Conserved hypothetical protein [Clostridium acetobutylicum EA 2018]AEI32429.1 hypothetical protein SMB_G2590 [Clostridium acetobutylicum DSM 1731]AWV79076.1 hypothetical protein DK921_02980 [Clostridium acetobutylicum]MBC2394962.1 hypothetical protein [Clostridium acetobutylicum]
MDRTSQGWYLCNGIPKTKVLNHRISITDKVYIVIQEVVDEVEKKITDMQNEDLIQWEYIRHNLDVLYED